MFEFKNVSYKDILKVDSLRIRKGRATVIVGASGSGKSTLMLMLNKMITPDSGEVYLEGAALSKTDPVALRRRVVMLPQNPAVYDGTVGDNLRIGLEFAEKPAATDEELLEALAFVELDKKLDDDASSLSGGERQRLGLARVLLLKPDVYLLDEPSSALDPKTEASIIGRLVSHVKASGGTVVMVTHSMEVARTQADDLIEVSSGTARPSEIRGRNEE